MTSIKKNHVVNCINYANENKLFDRLNEVYNSKSSVIDSDDAVNLDKINVIEFKDFSFKYINDKDYTMDADKIESLITDKTCAIAPVHVYGNICDVEKIREMLASLPETEEEAEKKDRKKNAKKADALLDTIETCMWLLTVAAYFAVKKLLNGLIV